MNFFKKLFGNKENPKQTKSENLNKIKDTNSTNVPASRIDVNSAKKESTKIKNTKGEFEAVKYLQGIIATNNLSFKDKTALLKKAIPYMVKAKELSEEENIKYINDCLDKHTGTTNLDEISRIIEIKSDIDNKEALIYLESIFPSIDEIKNKPKDLFSIALNFGELLLNENNANKAFQVCCAARKLIQPSSDKFRHISDLIALSTLQGEICFYGNSKPSYPEFLHYEILIFILEIAKVCLTPYSLTGFYHRKELSKTNGFWGKPSNEFKKAVKALSINENDFVKDINIFAFEELPIKMGYKKEYLQENITHDNNPKLWDEIVREFTPKFENTPFTLEVEIRKWIDDLIKNYHELGKSS